MSAYRGDAKWKFLEVTARRLAMNRHRATQTRKRSGITLPIDDLPEAGAAISSAETEIAERQDRERLRRQLRKAISKLPKSEQQCLLLWLNDYSYTEIQRHLGISLDAVKSRLHDARKRLRVLLIGQDIDR